MTEEIKKLLQAKVKLESQRLQYQDSKILKTAGDETAILYHKIWERIIKNADFSKEEASVTWGIYKLDDTTSKGRKEDFEMAKSFNARRTDEEILLAVSKESKHFVLSKQLRNMLAADNVTTRTNCGAAKNRWRFSIKIADLLAVTNKEEDDQHNSCMHKA